MPYKNSEMRAAASRECQRRRRAAGATDKPRRQSRRQSLPELRELRYKTLSDLLAVLGEEIDAVKGAGLPVEARARLLCYLCGTAARLIEGADMEARLAEVEAVLETLKEGGGHGEAQHVGAA